MTEYLEGMPQAGSNDRFAIVVSRFNDHVTAKLLDGALETLNGHGIDESRITIVRVPGAFEIPLVADRLARSGRYAGIGCLGAVIQGETDHHEHINQQVSAGIMRIMHDTGVPVGFGILTCKNAVQAMDRAGGKMGNKGNETMEAILEMVDLLKKIDG